MSQTIKTIDVHSHFILPSYLEGLEADGVDPLKEDGFPTPTWSAKEHIAYMDQAGIERSILSLSTPHIHHGNGEHAIALTRKINEEAASLCREYPDRFSFAACLPMPEVEASIKEIAYAYEKLGAVGIKVASNSNGVYLGDPAMDPIFEELNARKAVVIIHPSRPLKVPEKVFTEGPAPLFEYLADTTRAVINMITNGTLEKYPDIKVIVPHSGSFLPLVIHRLIGISEVLIPKGLMENVNVEANFSKLYFDIAGDTLPIAFDVLLKVADPSHIMYGGDFPYTPQQVIVRKKTILEQHPSIEPYAEEIFRNNALSIFGL